MPIPKISPNKNRFEHKTLVQNFSSCVYALFSFFALFRGKRHSDIINKSFVGGKMVKVYWPFSNSNVFFIAYIYVWNNMYTISCALCLVFLIKCYVYKNVFISRAYRNPRTNYHWTWFRTIKKKEYESFNIKMKLRSLTKCYKMRGDVF